MSTQGLEFETEEGIIRRRHEGMSDEELAALAKEDMERLRRYAEMEERRKQWEEQVERDNPPVEDSGTAGLQAQTPPMNETKGKHMTSNLVEAVIKRIKREGLSPANAKRNATILRDARGTTMRISTQEVYAARRQASAQR